MAENTLGKRTMPETVVGGLTSLKRNIVRKIGTQEGLDFLLFVRVQNPVSADDNFKVNDPALKGGAFGKMRGIASPLPLLRIHPRHEWRGILRDSHKIGFKCL